MHLEVGGLLGDWTSDANVSRRRISIRQLDDAVRGILDQCFPHVPDVDIERRLDCGIKSSVARMAREVLMNPPPFTEIF